MRLLHLSDWHLGRQTYRHSRADDHDAVIVEILEIARDGDVDLVLHTGDVFDGMRPAAIEMQRGIDALKQLAEVAPTLVIAGNHDSATLFGIFNRLLGEDARLHFVDKARPPAAGGILTYPGRSGELIKVAPLPFIHANRFVEYFEEPQGWTAEYAKRVHAIEENLRRGLITGYDTDRDVLLFAAHLYVQGATYSGSERPLTVSDTYASRVERIPEVSYAAFGHIHRPQELPGATTGRYAGSPLQLDFGEENETKEVVLVDAKPGRPPKVEPIQLTSGRRLRSLSGTLEELAQQAADVGSSLCKIIVRTEEPLGELAERVREMFPDASILDVQEDCAATRVDVLSTNDIADGAEESFSDLFREYLKGRRLHGARPERVFAAFDSILHALDAEEDVVFTEDPLLEVDPEPPQEATG